MTTAALLVLLSLAVASASAQESKAVDAATVAAAVAAANPVPVSETAPSSVSTAGSGLTTEPLSIEDSLSLRDPFKKPAKFADPSSDLSVPELERFTLDQIKIVGIITGPKKAKALITTPSNKMFIVQENDKIGVYKGFIRKIKDKSIVVREKIVNLVGVEESADNEIFLKSADSSKDSQQISAPADSRARQPQHI